MELIAASLVALLQIEGRENFPRVYVKARNFPSLHHIVQEDAREARSVCAIIILVARSYADLCPRGVQGPAKPFAVAHAVKNELYSPIPKQSRKKLVPIPFQCHHCVL